MEVASAYPQPGFTTLWETDAQTIEALIRYVKYFADNRNKSQLNDERERASDF